LNASMRRVGEALRERDIDAEVRELPDSTRTAPEAAAALGCEVAQIVKSLVFRGEQSGDPVLVLVSGADRVDERLLAQAAGEPIGKAEPDFVRERTGFAIGGVPPFGHDLPVLFDEALLSHKRVWAAAGDPHSLFCVDPQELARCVRARIVALGE
jgi:prolyl-tRNA editing enzyme YbaK/EbsC (Cys-tRNA(Pro) deacylase)